MKVFGITGASGSGKTTLIEAMLPILAGQGISVNVIKHSHHDIELEPDTKDSARLRRAGAAEVLISSPYRFAIFHELRGHAEPDLHAQLQRLSAADLTLVEGFRAHRIPRLEVFRPSLQGAARYPEQHDIVAVASDSHFACPLPVWPLNDPEKIAACILEWFETSHCDPRFPPMAA